MPRFEQLQSLAYEDFVAWLDNLIGLDRSAITNTVCRECKEREPLKGKIIGSRCKRKDCIFLGQSRLEELMDYLNYEIKA